MAANAHLADYPQRMFPAVTVNRADFRILPTREPHSRYPKGPGKDHPFDNLQESSAPAGMPVLVTLVSRDRKWFLAETSHLLGWVPATDIAAVDPEFMKSWENGRYVAIVRDKAPVKVGKRVLFRAPLGGDLPNDRRGCETDLDLDGGARRPGKALLRKAAVAKRRRRTCPCRSPPPCRASRPGACRRTLRLGRALRKAGLLRAGPRHLRPVRPLAPPQLRGSGGRLEIHKLPEPFLGGKGGPDCPAGSAVADPALDAGTHHALHRGP